MDYLITGGNGFVGSNLIAYILSREPDANVINLDLKRKDRVEELMGISEYQGRYTFKEGDICDLASYEHYLKVSDVVVNCASENDKDKFNERMERFIRTNITGARILADACCRNNVPLVHISTDEVYGSCPFTVQRRDEGAPIDPTNSYSTTMAAGERLVSLAAKRTGVPVAIIRPCMLVGPNQSPRNLVPRTIKSIMEGKPPMVWGKSGEKYRDWMHVLDMCRALEMIIRSATGRGKIRADKEDHAEHSPPGKTVISGTSVATTPSDGSRLKPRSIDQAVMSGVTIFNITAEMRHSISAMVEKVMEIMSSELPIQESSEEIYRDLGYNPSGRKIAYHGWQARFNGIEEILGSTIEWYRENPDILDTSVSGRLMP